MATAYVKVRDHIDSENSNWRTSRSGFAGGGGTPSATFNQAIELAFENVGSTFNHARHCRLDELYKPSLGEFRQRKYYSSLAPSGAMDHFDRVAPNEFRGFSAYAPKRGEWRVEKDRPKPIRVNRGVILAETPVDTSLISNYRRVYSVPTAPLRHENFATYWRGRVQGLDYLEPFLRANDWRPASDRRYERIYWAPQFISLLPTTRHATNFMLSAY